MATNRMRACVPALLATLAVACGGAPAPDPALRAALDAIDPARIEAHVAAIADPARTGRPTGSLGHLVAARHVADRLAAYGARPADGADLLLPVPLVAARVDPATVEAALVRDGDVLALEWGEHLFVAPDCARLAVEVDAGLHLVGHGVRAPGRGHDDYAGQDVRGKVVAIVSGAPASFPPTERAWHARRTLKRVHAAEAGAVGILWLESPARREARDTSRDDARAPMESTESMEPMESMCLVGDDGRPAEVADAIVAEARLTAGGAAAILGDDADPVSRPIAGRLRLRAESTHRSLESPNVAAVLEGSVADPDEYVLVIARLDHLAHLDEQDGEVHPGAYDDASGVARMLEIARVWSEAPRRPRRSLLLLATTGEEQGRLGARHFAREGPVPTAAIVAAFDLDTVPMSGPPRGGVASGASGAFVAVGAEHSSLGDDVDAAAALVGLRRVPDPIPDEAILGRSDPFPFVEAGVPAVLLRPGMDTGHGPEAGARFARVQLALAWRVADAPRRPAWHEGDFLGNRVGAGADGGR